MAKYPKTFKERVVREYKKGVRGHGFDALSKRFLIQKMVIKKWWRKWNSAGRSIAAFEEEAGGDRRSILTEREKERYILDFVSHQNAIRKAVDYNDVHANVIKKTKKEVSLRTIQEIGKEELDISWKKTTQTLVSDGMYCVNSHVSL
jgi:transposase-like protein